MLPTTCERSEHRDGSAHYTSRERSERRDGSAHYTVLARRRRRKFSLFGANLLAQSFRYSIVIQYRNRYGTSSLHFFHTIPRARWDSSPRRDAEHFQKMPHHKSTFPELHFMKHPQSRKKKGSLLLRHRVNPITREITPLGH